MAARPKYMLQNVPDKIGSMWYLFVLQAHLFDRFCWNDRIKITKQQQRNSRWWWYWQTTKTTKKSNDIVTLWQHNWIIIMGNGKKCMCIFHTTFFPRYAFLFSQHSHSQFVSQLHASSIILYCRYCFPVIFDAVFFYFHFAAISYFAWVRYDAMRACEYVCVRAVAKAAQTQKSMHWKLHISSKPNQINSMVTWTENVRCMWAEWLISIFEFIVLWSWFFFLVVLLASDKQSSRLPTIIDIYSDLITHTHEWWGEF